MRANQTCLTRSFISWFRNVLFVFASGIYLYSQPVFADVTTPDASVILSNIANDVPQLMQLVTAVAYVMGFWFVFIGIMKLREHGEQRSSMSANHDHLKTAIIYIAVGAALVFLPSSIVVGVATLFGASANPYGYVSSATDEWSLVVQNAYIIIQLIGVISFIRGLVILTHSGGHGAQQGNFARGITFIIAGVFCINLYDFLNVIENTLDISLSVSATVSGAGS